MSYGHISFLVSTKNTGIFQILTTNNVVSFEQPGPVVDIQKMCIMIFDGARTNIDRKNAF